MKLTAFMMLLTIGMHAQDKTTSNKWRIDKNKIWTGGLAFVAGSSKGFNETLQFNYQKFRETFGGTNDQWFNPKISWRNKYEGGNPDNGPKYFLSTSLLVMLTDQYHLNNFIHKSAILSALVIKLGEKKKPFRHYVFDLLYYSACYQAGFAITYYPFTGRNYK
jgi:hypothetical protein